MTKKELAMCLAMLNEEYPNREITDELTKLWERILQDLPDGSALKAVERYLGEHHEFFPKVGHIRQIAFDLVEPDGVSAHEAFAEARRQASAVGASGTPTLPNDETAQTIKALGGWVSFCLNEEELHWQRKRFIEVYERVVEASRVRRRELPQVTSFRERQALPSREESKKLLGGDEDGV